MDDDDANFFGQQAAVMVAWQYSGSLLVDVPDF